MNLEITAEEEINNLEKSAKTFVSLVDERNYKKARDYYKNLNEEEQKYIQKEKKYEWRLRALSFSNM